MSVTVRWILGATAKRYGRMGNPNPLVGAMDDWGYYPVTFVNAPFATPGSVRVQIMRGSKAIHISIPKAVYDALRSGEYVADEG